jgi:signal transduction histidine kinase
LPRRSFRSPIALGLALLSLVVALAVGWQLLVSRAAAPAEGGLAGADWALLVLGAVSFLLVVAGLVWLWAWLVREIGVNQRQRAFLDAVTHEMRTPLASLRLHVDTLDRHDPGRERREEFLGRMRDDVDRLDRTVQQVLSAARAEESGRRARLARVPLRPLLAECIAELRERHGLAESAVHLEVERDAPVRGDRDELAVVFRNLLDNAVKYSDDPVEVSVRIVGSGEGRVRVEISDRGIGIPSGELRKIFGRFYRAGRDVQRTASGLGLGLFIVRNLVRRQGGRVEALSEGAGRGSRFVVMLRAAR